jgi:hypothetical protein
MRLAAKWAVLALVVAVVGVPISHVLPYAILVIAAVIVFSGEVIDRGRAWLMAVAIALIAVAGQYVINPPRIDEGHNVFLDDGPGNALVTGLPPEVYRLMAAEFDKVYPAEKRCDPQTSGCWRREGFPPRTYAFSGDGVLDGAPLSRRVAGIDFTDPVWLRLGFTNDARYNWNRTKSDIARFRRDGRFWMGLQRWQLLMPYFVMYQFPAAYVGSDLCWTGDVIWEERNEQFALLSNTQWACRPIETSDIGKRIFGLGIKPGSLAMSLEPPVTVAARQAIAVGSMVFGAVAVIGLLARWRTRNIVLPATLISLALIVIAISDASFIGGFRPLDAGDDGLWYESTGRSIVQHLLAGNFHEALKGGEAVFYYGGPGLRYLRAVERFIFGDTNLGYLSLVLLLPLIVCALYRRFLPGRWALALALIFVALPVGALFGTTFHEYAGNASRGYADTAAYVFALAGTLCLVGFSRAGPGPRLGAAFGSALLFALAIFVRPNLAPFTAVMLAGAGLAALYFRQWTRLAGLCLGFAPALLMPLHNWYFGGAYVLFSANSTHPLVFVMPPSAYTAAAADLFQLNVMGEPVARAALHLLKWLMGPSELAIMAPINAAAIVIVIYVALRSRFDPWLRLIAVAAIAQLCVGLFYIATPRYHYLAWFFVGLVTLVWLQAEGLKIIRYRYPEWWQRAARMPFNRWLEIALRRFQKATGMRDRGALQGAP